MSDPTQTSRTRSFSTTPTTAARGRVRLRTLSNLRWLAVSGQSAALLIVYFGFGYSLPLAECAGIIAASDAGMIAVLVPDLHPPGEALLARKPLVLASLAAVAGHLRAIAS